MVKKLENENKKLEKENYEGDNEENYHSKKCNKTNIKIFKLFSQIRRINKYN